MQHMETFPRQFGESQTDIGTQSVPPNFYETIIKKTLETIYTGPDCAAAPVPSCQSSSVSDNSKLPLFIQYRVNAQRTMRAPYIDVMRHVPSL